MSDLIKRDDAIKAVSKVDDYDDGIGFEVRSHCLVELELVPSADRPRGEWKHDLYDARGINKCSECGSTVEGYGKDIPFFFCPYCGADMRGADNEAD